MVGRAREPAFAAAHLLHLIRLQRSREDHLHSLFVGRVDVDDGRALATLVADYAGYHARVDAADAGYSLLVEYLRESFGVAEIARVLVAFAHHHAADRGELGLEIFVRDSVVADQGVGHHNHLTRVRRIGEDLLISHHRSVENQLANALHIGSVTVTEEFAAVLEN